MNGSKIKSRVAVGERKVFVNVKVWDGTLNPSRNAEVSVVENLISEVADPGQINRANAQYVRRS